VNSNVRSINPQGGALRTNYVLIDYESVQPQALSVLQQEHFKDIVFVGASQAKVSFAAAEALQRMGSKAEYVKISGTGRMLSTSTLPSISVSLQRKTRRRTSHHLEGHRLRSAHPAPEVEEDLRSTLPRHCGDPDRPRSKLTIACRAAVSHRYEAPATRPRQAARGKDANEHDQCIVPEATQRL